MRRSFSILLAGLLLLSFNFTSSFATSPQKNDKSLSNSTAHLNNAHGNQPSENPGASHSNRPSENPGKGIDKAPGKNGEAGASLLPHGQKCVAHSTSTDKNINGVANGNGEAANCGPTYAVGSTGPGGGVIFYYDAGGFNCGALFSATGSPSDGLCHYLEVAPANWSKPNCDSTVVWNGRSGVNSNENNVCDPNLHWADANHQWIPEVAAIAIDPVFAEYDVLANIGGGYFNSVKIVEFNANCTNSPTPSDPRPCITAAGAARAFQGGGLIDWFLPNMAELNLLCKYAVADLTGPVTSCTGGGQFPRPAGLNQQIYWSSSAAADGYGAHAAWESWFEDGAYRKGFIGNWVAEFVRPVRSF